MVVCLVLAVTRLTVDSTDDSPERTFLAMYAAEILVIFGITATLIWLPWEEYEYSQPSSKYIANKDIELY